MEKLASYPAAERLEFLRAIFRNVDMRHTMMCDTAQALGYRVTKFWDTKNGCPVFEELKQEVAA